MSFKTKFSKISILLLILLLLLLVAVIFIYSLSQLDYVSSANNLIIHYRYPRLLDGVLIANEEKTKLKPIAVIIENHLDSRPQNGLEEASIVYETIVEGDITRYLAIFNQNFEAEKIGPVRSIRPYFIEWAEEWDPVLYHSGGSPAALKQLKQGPMWNLDEISANGIYYWRDKNGSKPHNLYTSSELVKQSLADKEIDLEANFSPWLFKDDLPLGYRPKSTQKIIVDFGTPEYKVSFKYNPQNNSYQRYLAGEPHMTVGANQIWAKNVVKLYTNAKILDRLGRLKVDTENGGKAIVYQDGKEIQASWKKADGRTRFFNKNGQEIKFNRGSIWIEVLFTPRHWFSYLR